MASKQADTDRTSIMTASPSATTTIAVAATAAVVGAAAFYRRDITSA